MAKIRVLRFAILPLALTVAVGLAACGDDDATDDGTSTIEAAEDATESGDEAALARWRADAVGVCADATIAIGAATADFTGDESADELADVIVENIQGQVDDLRDLEAPGEIAEQVDEMLGQFQSGVDAIAGDSSLATADAPPEGFVKASAIAEDLGLGACAF